MRKLESGRYTFWKCYIKGAPRKKQYHCFPGALKVQEEVTFIDLICVESGKSK